MDSDQPDEIRVTAPELRLAELERLFLPTLRRQGFLARTFRLQRAPVPDWLLNRHLEGSLHIKDLLLDDVSLGSVQSRVVWNGIHLQFPNVQTRLNDTLASGKLTVSLANAAPQYRFTGRVNGLDYRDGKLDLEGIFETAGSGTALLRNTRSEGTFSASGIDVAPDIQADEMSGAFQLDPGAVMPRLSLTRLQVTQGENVLHGQGSSLPDGRIVLDLMSGRRPVRLTGMLLPVRSAPPVP